MSELNVAFEVWSTIKDQLKYPGDAAADVVNCLIDNLGYNNQEISESDFVTDPDIKRALVDFDLSEEEEDDGLDEWGDKIEDDEDDEDDY